MAERALRVLVCGGRNFDDALVFGSWIGGIHKQRGIALIIDGGATGADRMARKFGQWAKIPAQTFEAEWKRYGRMAGPIRNRRMLDEGKPDLVVAFKGGTGTANMMGQARERGVPVLDTTSAENVSTFLAALAAHEASDAP